MNCTEMGDGNYLADNGQCSKSFWHCSNGKTTGRVCRDDLFFNTITKECDLANNIENCVNKSLIFNFVYITMIKGCDRM